MHWGAFTEARHPWNELVRRATAEAARRGMTITTPEVGQSMTVGAGPLPQRRWQE